jgi:alpha-N-arabinofuranosidase
VGRFKEIPYLDVTSVKSTDGKCIYVNVVNRHQTDAITADISDIAARRFGSKATISLLEGKMDDKYVAEKENEYVPNVTIVAIKDDKVTCTFPAHSLTQIAISLKQ